MADTFDVEEYAQRYSGHNRINRLLFVAQRSTSKQVVSKALSMAKDLIMAGENTAQYTELKKLVSSRSVNISLDSSWVPKTEKASGSKLRRIEDALNSARTELMKESTRKGHNDLGDQYYACGQLQNALKSYVRSKDFCSHVSHHIEMYLNVIRVSNEIGQYASVVNYAARAEQTVGAKSTDYELIGKIRAAHGLVLFGMANFKEAADQFMTVYPEMGSNYTDVVAPEDVALYGSLCALATYDRKTLREQVLENSKFKSYLELMPKVRELVQHFASSRYGSCLQLLNEFQESATLDIRLAPYFHKLFSAIRERALVSYCRPFSTVLMEKMAEVFKTTVTDLQQELARLIAKNTLNARIDSYNKVLVTRNANERKGAFSHALKTGQAVQAETESMLLRLFLLQENLVHKKNLSRPGMLSGLSNPEEVQMDASGSMSPGGKFPSFRR